MAIQFGFCKCESLQAEQFIQGLYMCDTGTRILRPHRIYIDCDNISEIYQLNINYFKSYLKSAHADCWSCHRLRTLDCSLIPTLTWTEIFPWTCLQIHLKTSPPTLMKSYPKFWNRKFHLYWPQTFLPAAQGQRTHSARTNCALCSFS
jgi:hypothetical protein